MTDRIRIMIDWECSGEQWWEAATIRLSADPIFIELDDAAEEAFATPSAAFAFREKCEAIDGWYGPNDRARHPLGFELQERQAETVTLEHLGASAVVLDLAKFRSALVEAESNFGLDLDYHVCFRREVLKVSGFGDVAEFIDHVHAGGDW